MVAILLSGWVAWRQLPLSALPQVDYPTIQVVTLYPGASPDVVTSSITAPLERQFGQMPGLKQMSSTSSGGASVITLQFDLAIDLDSAEQEVQASINAGGNLLPADLGGRRPLDGGREKRHQRGQREPGQGQLRRPRARLHHRRQRPDPQPRGISPGRRGVQERRTDLPLRHRRRGGGRRERAARR